MLPTSTPLAWERHAAAPPPSRRPRQAVGSDCVVFSLRTGQPGSGLPVQLQWRPGPRPGIDEVNSAIVGHLDSPGRPAGTAWPAALCRTVPRTVRGHLDHQYRDLLPVRMRDGRVNYSDSAVDTVRLDPPRDEFRRFQECDTYNGAHPPSPKPSALASCRAARGARSTRSMTTSGAAGRRGPIRRRSAPSAGPSNSSR